MDQRVTIQQDVPTVDTHGGQSVVPTTLATVWANIQHYRYGEEQLRAQAIVSGIRWLVTLYYRTDITAKMRLLWTPTPASASPVRTLEINAVRFAPEDPLFLELDCMELA